LYVRFYSASAPSLKFDPLIYHPNISPDDGRVCVSMIRSNWTPGNTLILIMSFGVKQDLLWSARLDILPNATNSLINIMERL